LLTWPEEIPDDRDDIERSGLFDKVRVKRCVWRVDYTTEQYIDLLNTYSGHFAMKPVHRTTLHTEVRRSIDARPDHRIRKHYVAILPAANLINDARNVSES